MVVVMKPPIFVCALSQEERKALEAGLRSKDAFVLRRSQILLASSRGESPPKIARSLGCGSQTVRNAIHDFDERGLGALKAGSSRPKRTRAAFDEQSAETLREMLHRSPREFGYGTSLWTLEVAAEVAPEPLQRGYKVPALLLTLIHRNAWKWNSRKFAYSILYSPGPIGPESPHGPTPKR